MSYVRPLLALSSGLLLLTVFTGSSPPTNLPEDQLGASLQHRDVQRPKVSIPTPQVRTSLIGGWIYDPEISWYGAAFYGNRTACGDRYGPDLFGVAHRSLPCGTRVEFRWKGRQVEVSVNDRGPYVEGRTWDLSYATCLYLAHCFTGPIEYRIVQ